MDHLTAVAEQANERLRLRLDALREERAALEALELDAIPHELAAAPERPVPPGLNPGRDRWPSYTWPEPPPSWWRRQAALLIAVGSGLALIGAALLALSRLLPR